MRLLILSPLFQFFTAAMTDFAGGYALLPLPPSPEIETMRVLRALLTAHAALAELKGVVTTLPNPGILIRTLSLREAKDSSEVEAIITTHDELFQSAIRHEDELSSATKEVLHYVEALAVGQKAVQRSNGLIRGADILAVQEILERNQAGWRRQAGTTLQDSRETVIYTPPQDAQQILDLMDNWVQYCNDDELWAADPLVKMAVLHYQFESIHPFYDGNGRTGRILNILYLKSKGLLEIPVLYLSRYITRNKPAYYAGLQSVRDTGNWEPYLLYMVEGVRDTATDAIRLIRGIALLMKTTKRQIRSDYPRLYSQDLINNLFQHPYTKIEFLERDLGVSRQTASKYLNELVDAQILERHRIGRSNFYLNRKLYDLLVDDRQ
jgi:Fic family protein